ncbi:MAG: hypothetical protein AAF604_09995 [Acidobacteriota bacterium]
MSLSAATARGLTQVIGHWLGPVADGSEGPPQEAPGAASAGWVSALEGVEGGLRWRALEALRRRLDDPPLERIDSSWLAHALPADPLLRLWALDRLPESLRRPVLEHLDDTSRAWAVGSPPPWFEAWWQRRLQRSLAYPRDWPAAIDPARPWSYLDRLPAGELLLLLERFGLRGLAAGLPRLGHRAALAAVFSLPVALRVLLRQRAADGGKASPGTMGDASRRESSAGEGEAEAWGDLLRRELEAGREGREVPLVLALEDLAAQASAGGEAAAGQRLALRLPQVFGRRLRERLAQPNQTLVVADGRQWQRSLTMEIGRLRAQGLIGELPGGPS